MKLRIDTTGTTFLAATEPETIVNPTTNTPKVSSDGIPMFSVQVVSMGSDGAEVLKIKVAGKPSGVTAGIPVKVIDLVATPWALGDRNGIAFQAARVEAIVNKL